MSYFSDASLVFIPSAQKSGKAYSIKPTDGTGDLTFTRSNDTATRVGPDGLIQRVRTNVLLQSNSFDTTWVNTRSTDTSGQAGYDGTNNAWLLESTASPANEAYIRQTISASGSNTFSIYAKAGTSNFLGVYINATSGTDPSAYFNLSTGAVGTTSATATASIVSVGSGWYRCSIAYNATIANIDIYVTDADGSFISTSGANILIQASQLESGDIATQPILTTTAAVSVGPVANVPRLDYIGSTCGKLILEPQRTNLALQSEAFNNAAWTKGGSTITSNATVSPDGYTNADAIVDTATNAEHNIALAAAATTTSNSAHTISVFLKSGTQPFAMLRNFGSAGQQYFCVVVNLDTGTITKTQAGSATTSTAATITNYGNGWYRVTATCSFASTINYPILNLVNSATPTIGSFGEVTYLGNGTNSVFAWGFQLENASAYATSYIPTLGSAVTRGSDAASKTGISSLLNSSQGTIFLEVERIGPSGDAAENLIFISDTSTDNFVNIIFNVSTSRYRAQVREGGVTTGLVNATAAYTGSIKIAMAYAANDLVLYINGVQQGIDTSVTIPSAAFDSLGLGGVFDGTYFDTFRGNYSQALLFKTRLSNADLAALTA